jgi:hypothetical protein
MRWCLLLFVALVASNCNWPMGTTTGAAGTTGAGGGTNCAAAANCPMCAANSHCSMQAAACTANGACLAIDGCVSGCPDATCRQGCPSQNPDGQADYQAYNQCVYCQQCPATGLCLTP